MVKKSNPVIALAGVVLAVALVVSGASCIVVPAPVQQYPPQQLPPQPPIQQTQTLPPSQQPAVQQQTQPLAPTSYPTQAYQPATAPRDTSGRLLVWTEHPYISPWGEMDIDSRGVSPGGIVSLTVYGPDNQVAFQMQRFGEWDREADFDLHAGGWAAGQYRAVVKDMSSGMEGETFVNIGSGSQYYYDD